MTPVEQTSICSARQPTTSAASVGHAPRIVQAALPGAGVGVAGADDHAAYVAGRQALLADAHRGGPDAVLREDARRRGRHVADDQGQVAALGIGTEAAVQAGVAIASGEVPGSHEDALGRRIV